MSIELNHSGEGDNVMGNKYITHNISQALVPKDVSHIVREIMCLVATRKYDQALSDIVAYNRFPLSKHVESLFKILEKFISDIRSNRAIDASLLKASLAEDNNSQFINLYRAILIRSIFQQSTEEAIKTYNHFKIDAKSYLLAVYDELLANKDELEERLNKYLHALDNYSLICLAKGLHRIQSYKLSKEVFQKIATTNDDEYSQFKIKPLWPGQIS